MPLLSIFLFGHLLPALLVCFYAGSIVRFNARIYPAIYNWPSQGFWIGFLRFMCVLWIAVGVSALVRPNGW